MRNSKEKRQSLSYTLQSSLRQLLCRDALDDADKRQKLKTETKFIQTKSAREIGKFQKEIKPFRC